MSSRTRLILAANLIAFLFIGCGQADRADFSKFLQNREGAVFVFLAPDCPLSQSYTSTLNELRAPFEARGIEAFATYHSFQKPRAKLPS